MNGASMLKKTLPVLLTVAVLIAIGLIVSGLLGKEKLTPAVSDSDVVYIQVEEDGNIYKVTKGQMYDELKSNVGLSSLVTLVNKVILENEKNDEGKSFYSLVTDEEVIAEIDEAIYGTEEEAKELSADERNEKEQDFIDSMFKSFSFEEKDIYVDETRKEYAAKIKEYYKLTVAKEKYAEYQLAKEIAEKNAKAEQDSNLDPYFDDDEISDYYSENYNKSFWGIIVPFTSSQEAEYALQQLGVMIDEANDRWVYIVKEEIKDKDGNGTGVYELKEGVALTASEVVDTFIKLYNMVYGHTTSEGKVLGTLIEAGKDYNVYEFASQKKDLDAAVKVMDDLKVESATDGLDAIAKVNEQLVIVKEQVAAIDEIIKESGYTLKNISDVVAKIEEKVAAYDAETTDDGKKTVLKDLGTLVDSLAKETKALGSSSIVFAKTDKESSLFYDYDELTAYNSSLRSKFNSTYTTYYPFAQDSSSTSTNESKPTWYSYKPVSLSTANSKTFYTLSLKLGEEKAPELKDVKEEILKELAKEELTDSYIETKMAQLRANYEIVIFDSALENEYITSVASYSVTHDEAKDESDVNVVSFKLNTYEKVSVSNKKEFKKERKANGSLFVNNNGLYEEVKKYSEGQEYFKRNEGAEKVFSADELYVEMEEKYGASVALSQLTYQRFLNNNKFNKYKDMANNKWLDEDKRKEYIEEIETQRVNFLAGGYASYGYSPANMSWEEFMSALYGAKNEVELAESYLYSDIISDYASLLNYIVKVDEEGEYVNTDYAELVESDLWKFYEAKMNEMTAEFFNVTGIHFLVSKYDDLATKVDGGTPISPKEEGNWTEEEIAAANELIGLVKAYVKASSGTYAAALQEIQTAFESCPYYVDGKEVEIYDANGNVVEYKLTKAEVTIDVAKYKSLGLYVKYEDLGQFVNGTMVEEFNDAVKKIWDQDMADDLTDRVTIYPEAIETEFGYHLYINLTSARIATYDSNEVKVGAENKWEYVYKDEDKEQNSTVERVIPQLYEVLLYTENNSHEELGTGALTAISTYYSTLATEVSSSYFSYICQYTELVEKLDANSFKGGSLDLDTVKKLVDLNIESWYENNFKVLTAEDKLQDVVVKELKGGK